MQPSRQRIEQTEIDTSALGNRGAFVDFIRLTKSNKKLYQKDMAIQFHPEIGTILICDFHGFIEPEMIKRRPVVVVSPRFRHREGLCTIVPLSTTAPKKMQPYHYKLKMDEPLPKPYDAPFHWVKGDMLATVSFDRLFMPSSGKDETGRRKYVIKIVDEADLRNIRECVLHALALSSLTGYL